MAKGFCLMDEHFLLKLSFLQLLLIMLIYFLEASWMHCHYWCENLMQEVANYCKWNWENLWDPLMGSSSLSAFVASSCFYSSMAQAPATLALVLAIPKKNGRYDFSLGCFALYNSLTFCKMPLGEVPDLLRSTRFEWAAMNLDTSFCLNDLHLDSKLPTHWLFHI